MLLIVIILVLTYGLPRDNMESAQGKVNSDLDKTNKMVYMDIEKWQKT